MPNRTPEPAVRQEVKKEEDTYIRQPTHHTQPHPPTHHTQHIIHPPSSLYFFSAAAAACLAWSSLIMRITSSLLFSTFASSSSFAFLRSSCVANHSSLARSSSSGFACATMHAFIASRCSRHTHVAVIVRLTAHSANATKAPELAALPIILFEWRGRN